MKDLRTPAAIKKADAEYKKWSDEIQAAKKRRDAMAKKAWGTVPWKPIASCPFEDYEHENIFVTDGKKTCLANVHKRFGTPMRVVKEAEMVMTDQGMAWVGGEYEKIKAPKWWFKWELEDVDGFMNYAGGHETGKDEVPFVATHWLPMLPGYE